MSDKPSLNDADGRDAEFEIDAGDLITYVDDRAYELIGIPGHELLGRPLRELLAPDQNDRLNNDRQRTHGCRMIRTEWRMLHGDGSSFVAEVIACGLAGGAMRFVARDATLIKLGHTAQARLAAIVESSADAIVSKTLTGTIMTWNESAERIFGYTADEMIGESVWRLVPADRVAEEEGFLACVARGDKVENVETVRLRKNGSPVFVSMTISPILDDNDVIVGASTITRDVTAIHNARERLHESEERFRALADNMSQFAWMADATGWIFWYNRRWYDYTGTTLEQMQGWGWKSVHHPDHVDRVVTRIQESWDSGEPWEDTFPLRGRDGEYRWFLSRALPIRDEAGKIVLWFGTNTDITEQKEREEQIRLLMREVNHRSKNMLALVQAIARQTATADPQDFIELFQERIQGLSASQNLLVQSGWRGAGIVDLVESQLAHFEDLVDNRIRLHGPALILSSSAAQAIGMVLHELGTNAGKYGALSTDTGTVDIVWYEQGDGEEREFHMLWQESGGPEVSTPTRQGFGSVVIEKMVGVSLGSTSDLRFEPHGVCWQLRGPSAKIVAERPPATPTPTNDVEPTHRRALRVLLVEEDPKRAMIVIEQLQLADHQAIGPASTIDDAFTLLGAESLDCAILGSDLDTRTAASLLERLGELDIPYFVLPESTHQHDGNGDCAAQCAPVAIDANVLLATIDQLCNATRSRC
ncbi:MAG: PAS domain S-box protein [Sphingomonadaceae bacterium]|nr:PAS domain S-box protein [Sphingomonadaceae bacterium]